MTDYYKLKQLGSSVEIWDDRVTTTIKNRINAAYEQMAHDMNTSLYGDREPPRPLTWLERLRRRANIYRNRIGDAWLVLTGRADIGDGY